MKRTIKKTAVLGSGTMGAQIACLFANAGIDVLLLDIMPDELSDDEKKKGYTRESKKFRNRIVDENLQRIIKLKPSPIYSKDVLRRITTGNFEDDIGELAEVDWILEAVLEKREIKQELFTQVERYRKPGTIVTTNTSGISIHSLLDGRSDDFRKHFCGTHFFNPPRYMELLELIPSKETGKELIDFLCHYGEVYLGKTVVRCNDTPAFIGNRIAVYGMMLTLRIMQELGMTVEEIDSLTGQYIGRPKSATFRTLDLVGLDVFADVAEGLYENCPDDEEREMFKLPDYMEAMIEKKWYGEKSGRGFYKRVKDNDGESKIYALDLKTYEYKPKKSPRFLIIEELKKKTRPEDKLGILEDGEADTVNFFKKLYLKIFGNDNNKAIEFYRTFFHRFFAYCSNRLPEITDDLYAIDDAIKAGFKWELGPFETWDVFGLKDTVKKMEEQGYPPAAWVYEMINKGFESFYRIENRQLNYYHIPTGSYRVIPGTENLILLDKYRGTDLVWANDGCNLIHIGDGVLNFEMTTKRHTINLDVLNGLNKSIGIAEKDYKGMVIGMEGGDFSLGADLAMIGMSAYKGKIDIIEKAIDLFQQTVQRIRYSSVPIVAAPYGRTLGGGVELCMHADSIQAAAETYMGLVEAGAGLIPAGGGTKEFTKRAAELYSGDDPNIQHLQKRLMTIAQAQVATSPLEAYEYGFLRGGTDMITRNNRRLLTDAKRRVIQLADSGYTPPDPKKPVRVLGRSALSFFYMGIHLMFKGNYITEYEKEIASRLAYIMTGGDLTGESEVDEQYLLNLEKDVFLKLIQNKKTLKRMEHLLKKGKPLRN